MTMARFAASGGRPIFAWRVKVRPENRKEYHFGDVDTLGN